MGGNGTRFLAGSSPQNHMLDSPAGGPIVLEAASQAVFSDTPVGKGLGMGVRLVIECGNTALAIA